MSIASCQDFRLAHTLDATSTPGEDACSAQKGSFYYSFYVGRKRFYWVRSALRTTRVTRTFFCFFLGCLPWPPAERGGGGAVTKLLYITRVINETSIAARNDFVLFTVHLPEEKNISKIQ